MLGIRLWYASVTDLALLLVLFCCCLPVASMTGAGVVSAENCGFAVAVLALGSMTLLRRSSIGSLLEVPQIQFIARVREKGTDESLSSPKVTKLGS